MAFSIFNKKEEPPAKRPAPAARAQPVPPQKPAAPEPAPQARAKTAEQLSQKIDQIQAEMEEFTLDFTAPPPQRTPAAAAAVSPQRAPSAAAGSAAGAGANAGSSAGAVTGAATRSVAAPGPALDAVAALFDAPAAAVVATPAELTAAARLQTASQAAAQAVAPAASQAASQAIAAAPPPPSATATSTRAPVAAAPSAAPPPAAAQRAKPVIERGFNPLAPQSAPVRRSAPPAATAASAPPAAAMPKPAAPKPVPPRTPYAQGVASVMMMEVEQSPFAAAPVLEEAAILYANGEDLAALAALSDALQNTKMKANAARQAYSLLFDLYENMGRRDEFDSASVEFAVRFETSPPAYNDRSSAKDPTLATGSGQYFALTGTLDAASEKQFAQLTKSAERNKILRIEYGKIDAVAAEGCALLLGHLRAFKKSAHDLVFSSSEHLIGLLNGAIETGRRSDPEVFWLLLLELYQFQQMQAAFEETALNYCITYEVSPPSWAEPAKKAASTAPVNGPATMDVPQDAFYLKGEITGASDLLFNDIAAHAGGKSRVVIDMFGVKRIDFIAAGAFLNVAQNLRGMQKEIEIRSPSPLLAALLVSMGFLNHVRLTRRGN